MKNLLFIDTNVYLDFYRVRNDVSMSLLNHLDSIRDSVVVTYQVGMEFKKHRQAAILETLQQFKAPSSIPRPGILSEDKSYKGLQGDIRKSCDRIQKIKKRLQRVFENPVVHDPVYKVVQRILTKDDSLNFTRANKIKHQIRRRAFRRFLYGYPPRKKGDTSIGDSVNWEWICEVCRRERAGIWIVSRDSDYGVTLDDKSYINDWLREEFRDRTSLQRPIFLTGKISEALKEFRVRVTPEEAKAEDEFVKKQELRPVPKNDLERILEELEANYDTELKALLLKQQEKNG